jgi:hypothetical protein
LLNQSDGNTGFTGSGTGGDGFVKVEYLHYDLGTASFSWVAQDTTTNGANVGAIYQNETTSVHNQGNILRVGLNCLW